MLDYQIISALGWTLIHFLWQGAAIVTTYWLISRSSKSLHAKYWAGMGAVILSLIIPISQFISLTQTSDIIEGTFTVSSQIHSMVLKPMSIWDTLIMLTNQALPFLVLIWAMVVLAMTTSLIRSWFRLNAIEHDCDASLSAELKQFIKKMTIRLDLATTPILKVSNRILVPAAYGIYKPTVLLPLSLLSQLPKDQVEAIITHELCHLKRNDFLHNILQITADILLFFHPLIRWMNNDIRQVREQCCDQLVLSQNTHAITYAKALTNIASLSNGYNFGPRLQIGINDGLLLTRVKYLLQNNSSQSSVMMFIPLAILLLACFYLFQSDQKPLAFNDVPMQGEQTQKTNLKKRLVSHLFYPSSQPEAAEKVFIPAAAELSFSDTLEVSQTRPETLPEPLGAPDIQFSNNLTPVQLERPDVALPAVDVQNAFMDSITQPVLTDPVLTSAAPFNDPESKSDINTINKSSAQSPSALIKPKLSAYLSPEYPDGFWKRQVEQTVIASFKIKPSGKLYDIEMKSQGNNYVAFEHSVKSTLRLWRFESDSLTPASMQKTYQQIFEFKLTQASEKNCELATTGTRIKKATTCKQ